MATKSKAAASSSWNNISGEIYVYGKEFGKGKNKHIAYSASVNRTEKDSDKKEYFYFPIRFVKDAANDIEKFDLDEPMHLIINRAFFTFDKYTNKDKVEVSQMVLVVMEFTECDE